MIPPSGPMERSSAMIGMRVLRDTERLGAEKGAGPAADQAAAFAAQRFL